MKKIILAPVLVLATLSLSMAQSVGFGTSTPDASAALEIKASDKGLLIPRTSSTSRIGIVSPAKGLILYDTTSSTFWFYNGSLWTELSSWALTGNAGTNPATNFLGTTDDQSLMFKVGNTPAGFLGTSGNAFWGKGSGAGNLTGHSNIAIGYDALKLNTDRSNLVAVGDSALYNNGTGASFAYQAIRNTAIGAKTLHTNTTGYNNTALGFHTLFNNTTGYNNTAVGEGSMSSSAEGHDNTGFGVGALSTSEGNYNTAIGIATLAEGGGGNNNTAVGYYALFTTHSDGNHNTGIGNEALYLNASGSMNTGLGNQALYSNGDGSGNTAIGNQALYSNVTGYSNVAIGSGALWYNKDRNNLVAIGDSALYSNGAGASSELDAVDNLAIGTKALFANGKGFGNTAIGSQAMYHNTTGIRNTATGVSVLYNNDAGSNNTVSGWAAMYSNTIGGGNTATGFTCLYTNILGQHNTAYGAEALYENYGGSFNTAAGFGALHTNVSGTYNTALGRLADVSVGNLTNASAIGANAIVNASNKVVIGDNNPNMVIGGYANWSNLSDGRFKENVKENVPGLEFITKLRPVTYTINTQKLNAHIMQYTPDSIKSKRMQSQEPYAIATYKIQTGFVAQDVEKIAKALGYDFDGVNDPKNPADNYSIAYSQFIMPLVKAVQEQQLIIEGQNKTNALQQQQLNALMKEIQLLKEKLK